MSTSPSESDQDFRIYRKSYIIFILLKIFNSHSNSAGKQWPFGSTNENRGTFKICFSPVLIQIIKSHIFKDLSGICIYLRQRIIK